MSRCGKALKTFTAESTRLSPDFSLPGHSLWSPRRSRPLTAHIKLDDLGSQYRLSYKNGSSDVVTLLGKDLIISEIEETSPEFVSIVKPQVTRSAKGFLLTGYVGDYTPKAGPGVVHLAVRINHAPVNGMQLPVSLISDSVLDGT